MSDNRPPVYYDSAVDRWVYRISAIGGCEKALTAIRMGATPSPFPEVIRRAMDAGTAAEDMILDAVTYNSDHFTHKGHDDQLVVEIPVGTKALLRGHTDRLIWDTHRNRHLIEAKNFGQSRFISWVRNDFDGIRDLAGKYAFQSLLYCVSLELSGIWYAVRNRDSAEPDEPGQIHLQYFTLEDLLEHADTDLTGVKLKVLRIEKHASKGTYPACPTPDQSFGCIARWLHDDWNSGFVDADDRELWKLGDGEVADEDAAVLGSLARNVLNAKAELARWKAAEQLAKDALKAAVIRLSGAEAGKYSLEVPGARITRRRGVSTVTDWDRMRGDGVDVDSYQEKKEYWYEQVTDREDA